MRSRKRMGWRFTWVSSYESDFNHDFNVSFMPERIAAGSAYYNFQHNNSGMQDLSGDSIFFKDEAGQIFHTYSTFGRGGEELQAQTPSAWRMLAVFAGSLVLFSGEFAPRWRRSTNCRASRANAVHPSGAPRSDAHSFMRLPDRGLKYSALPIFTSSATR
jgi:Bacterial protein of unknown function (DUF899)